MKRLVQNYSQEGVDFRAGIAVERFAVDVGAGCREPVDPVAKVIFFILVTGLVNHSVGPSRPSTLVASSFAEVCPTISTTVFLAAS